MGDAAYVQLGRRRPPFVFALKFRPKTEEEPDRHTGYFMSEKECILQHRGSLATIYQKLKNYAEEHKIIGSPCCM